MPLPDRKTDGDQTFRQKPSDRRAGEAQCLGEVPWINRATAMWPDAGYVVQTGTEVNRCDRRPLEVGAARGENVGRAARLHHHAAARPHNCWLAIRAPSTSAWSFAQATVGWIVCIPANVPKPQSAP